MINYYEILNISQTAENKEIEDAINRELRIWSNRTNAPQLEKRQEAEKMVQVLEDAEATLLDKIKRQNYDRKLKSSGQKRDREKVVHLSPEENLIKKGWERLIDGQVPEALYIAKKATEEAPKDHRAWELLGQARYRWGDGESAIYEYRRAIELMPTEACLYFDLGNIYESCERFQEAYEEYERAVQIDPSSTMYRAAIGMLLVRREEFDKGIKILSECVKEDPDNESYREFLGVAFFEKSYRNWTYVPKGSAVPEGYYATEKSQVQEADKYISRAEKLGIKDKKLQSLFQQARKDIDRMEARHFDGSAVVAGIVLLIGLVILGEGKAETVMVGSACLGAGVLYIFSARPKQYLLNQKILKGESGSGQFLAEMSKGREDSDRIIGWITGFLLLLACLPVIILWNFIRNYAMDR